jgi:DNA-binding CsgD family transcriptional regulator
VNITTKLTPRELQVLTLASKGYSYAETASLLGLTPSTVASYTKTLYEKLAVGSRSEAVFEATRLGLLLMTPSGYQRTDGEQRQGSREGAVCY